MKFIWNIKLINIKLFWLDELDYYFLFFKKLIENSFVENNNEPVTIIGHSNGGKITLTFLQLQSQEWKNKYIKSFIALAAPWGGSMKSIKTIVSGDDMGFADALSK